jgi:hypothetical protein
MIQVDDLSRSLIAFEQISTLVIVVELSQSSWLAGAICRCRATRSPNRNHLSHDLGRFDPFATDDGE